MHCHLMRFIARTACAIVLTASPLLAADSTDTRDAWRFVLIDAAHNINVGDWTITSHDLLPDSEADWSVRKRTLHGGKQEGVEIIEIDNGALTMTIVPTRGMNILEVRAADIRLGWDSPVKEVVHPRYIDLESRGGLGWLEGFNEWMVRCGLAFAGHPGKDRFITNTGDEAEMNLTLHGKIGNIPASKVVVLVDRQPPHRIHVRGVVHERMFYGPKLELRSQVSMEPGARTFHIRDQVINRGAFEQEFQIIYHMNFGKPLLGKGARVIAAARSVTPMNEHAIGGLDDYATYEGPTPGFIEQVYLIQPYADGDGKTAALLHNAAGDRGVSIHWNMKQLPYLTVWKNTAAEETGYVTGIEPATGYPFNRSVERRFGRVPKLGPGKSRRFAIDVAIHADQRAVTAAEKAIERLRNTRPTKMVRQPPKVD